SLPPPWQGGALPDELHPQFLTAMTIILQLKKNVNYFFHNFLEFFFHLISHSFYNMIERMMMCISL
ncbi:MAG: hypothetical protein ACLTXF_04625, partial [Acutalibacteraceae bacterium]